MDRHEKARRLRERGHATVAGVPTVDAAKLHSRAAAMQASARLQTGTLREIRKPKRTTPAA
jgi:hypothetical protein